MKKSEMWTAMSAKLKVKKVQRNVYLKFKIRLKLM